MKCRVGAILVAVMTMMSGHAYAQTVSGGGKVGVNLASLAVSGDDDDVDFGSKTGVIAGAFVDVGINDRVSFQPEFLFSQIGSSGELTEDDGTFDLDVKVNVFEVPLLFKLNFANQGSVRPFVTAGPGLSFRTSAKVEFPEGEDDIKDETAAVNFSGIVGAGAQVGRAIIEARYDHGFNDLDESDEAAEVRSRTFSILVGFGFGR